MLIWIVAREYIRKNDRVNFKEQRSAIDTKTFPPLARRAINSKSFSIQFVCVCESREKKREQNNHLICQQNSESLQTVCWSQLPKLLSIFRESIGYILRCDSVVPKQKYWTEHFRKFSVTRLKCYILFSIFERKK